MEKNAPVMNNDNVGPFVNQANTNRGKWRSGSRTNDRSQVIANMLCTADAVLKIKDEKKKVFTATAKAAVELSP